MRPASSTSARRLLSLAVVIVLAVALVPISAMGVREGTTKITPVDNDGNGKPDGYDVDWDGDGTVDEQWADPDEDGVIDTVAWNDGGDNSRSPRGRAGMRVMVVGLSGGGTMVAIDWDGNGLYDEVWWDFDGDGDIDDTDIYETESKVVDNTKATRFRGVFVGVKNGLNYPENDVDDLTGALAGYSASWDSSDMTKLKGTAATPAAIKTAIDAAKADSKPGDEFLFYFSGHGGGYDKDDGISGGYIDAEGGDETAIRIPESEFGEFDGSRLSTPSAGRIRFYRHDLDGDGTEDTRTVKKSDGTIQVWRRNKTAPPPWRVAGTDTNGDGKVNGEDGGVDMNGDGDKNDTVGVDDTILVANSTKVTDDQITQWLSGFPESVTIVVIIDACYSGSFVPDLKKNVKDSAGKPLRPGHLEVITAAPADEPAYERPISNGVLTQGLLDGLTRLSGSASGGHDTTYADWVGNQDDRTTTRELFAWAGPSATTYANANNDLDAFRNEDGAIHVATTPTVESADESLEDTPAPYTDPGITHLELDQDGDGLFAEDPGPMTESFFDVYYDPDFGGLPTTTFKQSFSGDATLSATGMMPGIGVWSEMPLQPGTVGSPGPTFELLIREVPQAAEPDPPPGFEYVGGVYDLSLSEQILVPELDEAEPLIIPTLIDLPTPLPQPVWLSANVATESIGAELWRYTEGPGWEPMPPPLIESHDSWDFARLSSPVDHFSQFALVVPLGTTGRAPDVTAPDDPWRLSAVADDDDVTLAWSNPTDPDFASTKVLRSGSGYASAHYDTDGQTEVCNSRQPFASDTDLDAGVYFYTAFSCDQSDNWSEPVTAWVKVGEATPTSIEGSSRYTTAVQASKAAFPADDSLPTDPEGYRSVVVATGGNWPDALGGSALAGAVGGPILLVGNTVPSDVATEIERLGADRVLLLGGPSAVSDGVKTALGNVTGISTVERIDGNDRYATAEAVAQRTVDILPSFDGTALVSTGLTFPDALAGSPMAAAKGWPILLTPKDALRSSTIKKIGDMGVTDAIVLGGEGAVSGGVKTTLASTVSGSVIRLAGTDRFSTGVAVSEYAVDSAGLRWDGVAISTGLDFPDALAGGVMQGLDGSVILLTRPSSLPSSSRGALTANAHRIGEVRFLGGPVAVSDTVRAAAMEAVE